jgi:GTP-binding protein
MTLMSFIDEAKFYVKGGDGGNGCVSFRREKYVPRGGPNGGDGGKGGDVEIVATRSLTSLLDFRYRSHFVARNGEHGKGKDMHGRGGGKVEIKVPVGSVIKNAETDEVLADLVNDGDRFTAALGGDGGLGNPHFASGTNRTPRNATPGKPGEEFWYKIELKLIADIGLIGLPNAGKSTLLSRLSAANPKVGAYPFTTLAPQLGVLQHSYLEPCIIADIPGLVEGAHLGVGLGHKFLRHVERTSVLLHVVDIADENAIENHAIIIRELHRYKEELSDRVQVVALNKIDLLEMDEVKRIEKYFKGVEKTVIAVSGATGENIEALKGLLLNTVRDVKQAGRGDVASDPK